MFCLLFFYFFFFAHFLLISLHLLFGCLLRLLTGVNIALGLEMLRAQARLAQTLFAGECSECEFTNFTYCTIRLDELDTCQT